jgi:hypothetical protein
LRSLENDNGRISTSSSSNWLLYLKGFLRSSSSSKGKQLAIRNKSVLLIFRMPEQVREVKVVIFCEKYRNPFAGMVSSPDIMSEVSFNGKRDIW